MNKSSTIRIFMDGNCFDKEFQGTRTFLQGLYSTLLSKFNDIDLYMGARDVKNISRQFPMLDRSRIIPYRESGSFRRYFYDLPGLIRRHGFDFAHFQFMSPPPVKGCKYIVTLHDILYRDFAEDFSFGHRWIRNIFFRNSIRRADIKTTVSEYSRDRIAHHFSVPPEKLYILRGGIDRRLRGTGKQEAVKLVKEKYGISDFILYTSRLEPRKNHLLLLKKYLGLRLYEQGISLVFAGKQSLPTTEFWREWHQMEPEQRRFIHWFEQLPSQDLAYFYRACRLFVFPSRGEGFGFPPLEAAICRVPVLCSSKTAMEDFTFFDPYRFDPSDEGEFESKLLQIINHPPAESFLEEIATAVETNYSWEKTAEVFYRILRKNIHHDQFRVPGSEPREFADVLYAGKAVSAPGDR